MLFLDTVSYSDRRSVWDEIGPAVRKSKGRVVAAVAYIGKSGDEILPLKKGDVLVCDASERSVKSGSTDPTTLKRFLSRGVEIRSCEGLHAKVIVLPRRAFVGSANASASSRDKVEAVIETTDTAQVRDLRSWVLGGSLSRRVAAAECHRLAEMMPKRTPSSSRATKVADLPPPGRAGRLLLVDITEKEGDWTVSAEEAAARSTDFVEGERRHFRGQGLQIDFFEAGEPGGRQIEDGDWVVQVIDGRAHSPGQVFHQARFRRAQVVYLARPKNVGTKSFPKNAWINQIQLNGFLQFDEESSYVKVLKGAKAESAVNLFR